MNFVISEISYFTQHGFDCTDWRKSTDGTQAICHLEYAQTLIPNIEQDSNVQIYAFPSQELSDLLNSSAWTTVTQ